MASHTPCKGEIVRNYIYNLQPANDNIRERLTIQPDRYFFRGTVPGITSATIDSPVDRGLELEMMIRHDTSVVAPSRQASGKLG